MKRVFTDRSRIETFGECNRRRWWEYHEGEGESALGLRPAKTSLYLARGGAVHAGLAHLLENARDHGLKTVTTEDLEWKAQVEENSVVAALVDFSPFASTLAVDTSERAALQKTVGSPLDADLAALTTEERLERTVGLFDVYLYKEQQALVEGLVRAYARRRLKALLEQYEVLEVEREGLWQLSGWHSGDAQSHEAHELWFMSRPDALLLDRQSHQLYLLSYKTTGEWDSRKARDIEHDMQGLSEGVEIEKRLGAQWELIHRMEKSGNHLVDIRPHGSSESLISPRMIAYLKECPAPPQILGIRYEFLLCGDRAIDKDLTQSMGVEMRSQRSHLVRGYMDAGMTDADERWSWAYDYKKEDGSNGRLYWKTWRGTAVWARMSTKEWINKLDESTETIGAEGRNLGYSSSVQQGYTGEHPLDLVFVPPILIYRNDDDLRDWIEETEASERRVAEGMAQVHGAKDQAEKRHLLNVLFPRNRRSCEYPGTCSFVPLCFGGADIRRDPLGSGRYKVREPNHPQEVEHASQSK